MRKRLVLVDTDIGDNIDDALCLAYLLAHDDVELLGITTVGQEAVARADLASQLTRITDAEIPIHPGYEYGLAGDPLPPLRGYRSRASATGPGAPAVDGTRMARQHRPEEAIAFLQRTIRDRPGEVDLLAIGPLTNVAQLFERHPACARDLRSLTVMGGVVTADQRAVEPFEHNTSADPVATMAVYRTAVRRHCTVGLDVARRTRLSVHEAARLLPRLPPPLNGWLRHWFGQRDQVSFSDPLAAATIVEPDLCRLVSGTVIVSFERRPLTADAPDAFLGVRTDFVPSRGSIGPHLVAMAVDVPRFLASLAKVLAQWAPAG